MTDNRYNDYYDAQVGGSVEFHGSGVDGVYVGAPHQRGHGIGSFLGGLFRGALPLLKKGARAVGKEALRAGGNIITDMARTKTPFSEVLRTRVKESGQNLKRRAAEKLDNFMHGSGYKAIALKRLAHSTAARGLRRISRGKKVARVSRTTTTTTTTRRKKQKKKKTAKASGSLKSRAVHKTRSRAARKIKEKNRGKTKSQRVAGRGRSIERITRSGKTRSIADIFA